MYIIYTRIYTCIYKYLYIYICTCFTGSEFLPSTFKIQGSITLKLNYSDVNVAYP